MYKKISLATLIIVISCLGCSSRTEDQTNSKTIIYQGVAGKTVFELLSEQHDVDFTESDIGKFINSIDGTKNGSGKYWQYYVNDQPGQVAADKAILSDGDKIEWIFK